MVAEERKSVLELVASGKVTTEQAERLLAALEEGNGSSTAIATRTPATPKNAKYLRVLVEVNDQEDGPIKVNVRVPLMLLRAGVRLASLIPDQAQDEIDRSLHEQGISFSIKQLKPEDIDELIDQLSELQVDVDGQKDNLKVKLYCE